MGANKFHADWVRLSEKLYKLLLLVYPPTFRQEYGGSMLQIFGDRARARYRVAGATGLLGWWGWVMLDTVQAAIEEHTQRGIDMSKGKFLKLSGWALLLGGPVILLGWLASQRPEYHPNNYYSLWIDRFANALVIPLFVLGILLLVTGYIGLLGRYGAISGSLGRFGLGLGILSGVASAVGLTSSLFSETEFAWVLFMWGLVFQFSGMALFGLACLRSRVLPRWNGLPLLSGIWLPLYALYSWIYERINGSWVDWPYEVFLGIWFISLLGLAGIGLLLLNAEGIKRPVQSAA